MRKLTITLHDDCARQMIRSLAKSYALLCIHSKLPADTVDAPWFRAARGKSMSIAYRDWMRVVDRERAAYRKSLQSVVSVVPEVPAIEWRSYTSPTSGKSFSAHYSATRAFEVAKTYASEIVDALAKAGDA